MPPERRYYEMLACGRALVRYDRPGCGLSGSCVRRPSMDLELEALSAVVDATGMDRVDLVGASLGAVVAAAWAAAHPDRVSRLVLYGGWVPWTRSRRRGGPTTCRQPGACPLGSRVRRAGGHLRSGDAHVGQDGVRPLSACVVVARTGGGDARVSYDVDVTDALARILAPTLVLHRDRDRAAPVAQGRLLAERIPGAELRVLPGRAHLPYIGDPDGVAGAIRRFLGLPALRGRAAPALTGASARSRPSWPTGYRTATSPHGWASTNAPPRGTWSGSGFVWASARVPRSPRGSWPPRSHIEVVPRLDRRRAIVTMAAMQTTRIRGLTVVGYSVLAYAAFLAASAWSVTCSPTCSCPGGSTRAHLPAALAVVVDSALLLVFALQHSVMARRGFKRRVARWIPAHAERSTYVLATSLVLLLLFWQWQPMSAPIWDLHGVIAARCGSSARSAGSSPSAPPSRSTTSTSSDCAVPTNTPAVGITGRHRSRSVGCTAGFVTR